MVLFIIGHQVFSERTDNCRAEGHSTKTACVLDDCIHELVEFLKELVQVIELSASHVPVVIPGLGIESVFGGQKSVQNVIMPQRLSSGIPRSLSPHWDIVIPTDAWPSRPDSVHQQPQCPPIPTQFQVRYPEQPAGQTCFRRVTQYRHCLSLVEHTKGHAL